MCKIAPTKPQWEKAAKQPKQLTDEYNSQQNRTAVSAEQMYRQKERKNRTLTKLPFEKRYNMTIKLSA